MSSSKQKNEELYLVLDVRSVQVAYPYCKYCYKRVLDFKKKWHCESCNEIFTRVDYRYKLCVEITNLSAHGLVTIFGKCLESLFGIKPNDLIKFKNKYYSNEDWTHSLLSAFKQCLIGRWMFFELKNSLENKVTNTTSNLTTNFIRLCDEDMSEYLTIYDYLKQLYDTNAEKLNFSLCTIDLLDTMTVDETISCEDEYESSQRHVNENICSMFESLKLSSNSLKSTDATKFNKFILNE